MGQGGPRRFNGQIRVEVGVSSLICHSVLAFAGIDGVISVDFLSRTERKFVLLFVV